jgi:predicted NBD/HSP70 family sugar kinase
VELDHLTFLREGTGIGYGIVTGGQVRHGA